MPRVGSLLPGLTLGLLLQVACASSGGVRPAPTSNEPTTLVLGRIKVQDGYKDITKGCVATFTDAYGNVKQTVTLDTTGYVFTRLTPGITFLERVRCQEPEVLYKTRELDFEVTAPELATYFGHVVYARTESAARAAKRAETAGQVGYFLGGVVGAMIMTAASRDHGREPPTSITVADRPQDLIDSYQRRHGGRELPVPMTFSIAGPATYIPNIVQHDNLLTVDADLEGLTLTWLGHSDPHTPRLALRLQRITDKPVLQSCSQLEVSYDGRKLRLPLSHQYDTSHRPARELAQAQLDAPTLRAITDAKSVSLKACNLTRQLGFQGTHAASQLFKAYEARMARQTREASEQPAVPAPTVQPTSASGGSDLGPAAAEPQLPDA